MVAIGIVLLLFGLAGLVGSLYARFKIKSPILTTEKGSEIHLSAISFQSILNFIFSYFAVLHFMFILIGFVFITSGK